MQTNQKRSHFWASCCNGGHNNRFNQNFMNYLASLGIFMRQGSMQDAEVTKSLGLIGFSQIFSDCFEW